MLQELNLCYHHVSHFSYILCYRDSNIPKMQAHISMIYAYRIIEVAFRADSHTCHFASKTKKDSKIILCPKDCSKHCIVQLILL